MFGMAGARRVTEVPSSLCRSFSRASPVTGSLLTASISEESVDRDLRAGSRKDAGGCLNGSIEMTQRYAHLAPSHLKQAVEVLTSRNQVTPQLTPADISV